MQLSRLEAKGFKSFGEKITIHFENGITGIVGPNGCGKSNVVDAIRWVLGEQKTRNLRSEKMEDVIFNGTKDRKPHQMAEVSITFNNTRNLLPTEYAQIKITRRYYRTGDSEYEINGVQCRLKDINNLFLDTGIGSDSYAIIELKMVEDLLNDREGSRRELFEEAAGISKFKIRKRQTLKKLDDTQKDLSRVEDLLFEIDKNLKSLEKQAKQAEKYYELKNEYRKLSIHLAHVTMANQAFEMTNLLSTYNTENDKKSTFISQISVAEAEIEKIKTQIITQEKELKECQLQLNSHVAKIRTYEGEKNIKNERLKYLNDTQDKLTKQIQIDKEQKEKGEILLHSINQEKTGIQKLLNEQERKVENVKIESDVQKEKANKIQIQLTAINQEIRSRQELVYKLNKTLEINAFQISSLKQELEKTSTDTNSQTNELNLFEDKLAEISKRLNDKSEYLKEVEESEFFRNDQIVTLETDINNIKDKISETNRKTDAKQNEYNLTKSLVDNLEGFPEAVRFLKKNAVWVKEVPLLSDIIACDEKYRIAIENYLEPFMNYYLVDSSADALKAVNLLSNSSMGKANFFMLKTFENFKANAIQIKANKVSAISIIEFEPKYSNLVSYLLDNVYLVLDNKEDFEEDDNTISILVNGKIIKKKHSISGGSVGLFEGKRIGRAKNLEILERDIKALNTYLNEYKQELNSKVNRLDSLKKQTQKAQIELLQKEFNQLKEEFISFDSKKEQLSYLLNKNSDRKEEIIDKINLFQEEIALTSPTTTKAQLELQSLEERLTELQETSTIETNLATQKLAIFNEENIKFFQLNSKFTSLEQEFEYKEANQNTILNRVVNNSNELERIEIDIKLLLDKSEVNDEELIRMYDLKEQFEFQLNETEKSYYLTRGNVDKTEKMVREFQRLKEISDTILLEINNKLNEGKLKLASIKERLSLEFNIDVESLSADSPPETDLSELEIKNKIEQYKIAMERIGQINPMAMEAYNEIKDRHDLISEQKNDIISARNSLLATISEIDITAKETFLHTFGEIKENFKTVFRSLFTDDDNCDLILVDPMDPLETDIDIIAKPKGKRPQSINQLSGGEKTLTAISLLFAIYLIKPAPFCIFDEVDAPLDDANIDKFNTIIKKFSADSQFIIVTHNKRTMASTDIIYGVTMIEAGISRVVPVDLRSLN